MGTVPISVIYCHKYPLSPVPDTKAGNRTPPSYRSSGWPSCLDQNHNYKSSYTSTSHQPPPPVVPSRKFKLSETNGFTRSEIVNDTLTQTNDASTQRKTRGCLSYISSLRSRQPITTTTNTTSTLVEPTVGSSSFNASTYSFRKPNLISSRSRTVDPNYSSYTNYSNLNSYRSLSRAKTVAPSSYPSSSYASYYSRSNVARSQDNRPSSTWYKPSRFTFSTFTSSFTRFKSTFSSFKSRYF